jgi:hypothetical protein
MPKEAQTLAQEVLPEGAIDPFPAPRAVILVTAQVGVIAPLKRQEGGAIVLRLRAVQVAPAVEARREWTWIIPNKLVSSKSKGRLTGSMKMTRYTINLRNIFQINMAHSIF